MLARASRIAAATVPLRLVRVAALALTLAALTLATSAGPALGWGASSFSAEDEQLLFTLTNQDRASAGLNALASDSYLHKEAEWRARDMGLRDYFSHDIPPDGYKVFYYMQKNGYCFKVAGENIGLSTYGDADATTRIEKAFMGSAGHRANILGTWTRMGVGAYKAADGRKLYTVLFSIPCSSRAQPKPVAPKPIASATAQLTPTPTPEPTATPTPVPAFTSAPIIVPVTSPSGAEQVGVGDKPNLRIREKADSPGPLDSLFRLLFGGIFG